MRIKRPSEEPAEINLTPIIDMVFLLLIFFLVATKFSDLERDLHVRDLPNSPNTPITQRQQKPVYVDVTKDGAYFWNGRACTMEELETRLLEDVGAGGDRNVIIRGDRNTALQNAVNVLDLCARHEIKHAYIATRPGSE